jgi:hypothetical protein
MHNFKTALKVLLVGILLGTAAAVSTPFGNHEGAVTRLNEKQEYVSNLLPDHTYGIVQKPAHSATTKSQLAHAQREGDIVPIDETSLPPCLIIHHIPKSSGETLSDYLKHLIGNNNVCRMYCFTGSRTNSIAGALW